MSLQGKCPSDDEPILDRIKIVSGWCIEQKRRRDKITQERLATQVGTTVRWLYEVESGSPRASIERHLRCAAGLGLSTGYLFILMMIADRQMDFPRELLLDDLSELEDRCIETIADFSLASLADRLRPARRTSKRLAE